MAKRPWYFPRLFGAPSPKPAARPRPRAALRLECLEGRCVPATINVTSLADSVAVDGVVTLREAIRSINTGANVNSDVVAVGAYGSNDTITFRGLSGTITLASDLDSISRSVALNGNTGAGFSAAPVITVDGNNHLTFDVTASNVTIRGLAIVGSSSNGILLDGASGAVIAGNYVGVQADGTTAGANRSSGVALAGGAANNTIGGTTAGAGNVISGNALQGIVIEGARTTGNVVEGNFIGTDAAGTDFLANSNQGVLIHLGASGNTIGGTSADRKSVV